MTDTKNTVSDEQLAEMLAGLEGVSPGPWDTTAGLVRSIDGEEAIPIFESRDPWKKHRRTATVMRQEWRNRQHIARCDPDTIRSLIIELQSLRASIPGGVGVKGLTDYLWQEFCELPDRSSPEDYPDMALVNQSELTAIVETFFERRALDLSPAEGEPVAWHKGEPPKPFRDEWFIALTTFGDRVVLRSLPDEWSYDYQTADETYIKADMIKAWMQFPDSSFKAFTHAAPSNPVISDEMMGALKRIRDASMLWAIKGQIPEAGVFGTIAQDADWLCDQFAALSVKPQSGSDKP